MGGEIVGGVRAMAVVLPRRPGAQVAASTLLDDRGRSHSRNFLGERVMGRGRVRIPTWSLTYRSESRDFFAISMPV